MPWGFVAGAAIGAVGSVISSGNAEDAANNATAAQQASASEQAQLGRDQLAWNKQVYNEGKPMRDAISQQALDIAKAQADAQRQQTAIAADYDAYNKGTFRPLEQGIVADAQGFDTPARRAAAMEAARADVQSAGSLARDVTARALARNGITSGSGRAQALQSGLAMQQAGQQAAATTGASRNIEQQGYARKMDAASLGRNLPSAQATSASIASQAGNASVNAGQGALGAQQAGIGNVNQGAALASSALGSAGSLYGQAGNTYNQIANATNAGLAGFGNAAGRLIASPQGQQFIGGMGSYFTPDASSYYAQNGSDIGGWHP